MNVDRVREEIRRRAQLFCCDNMTLIGKVHEIETAMLIGVSVVLEQPIDEDSEELKFTPESEELIRQLFEGKGEGEEMYIPNNETPCGIGKTYLESQESESETLYLGNEPAGEG